MFINYKKTLFVIIFVALSSYTGFSQNKDNQIKGRIADTNAAIVLGANVTAQNKASGRVFRTQTNESSESNYYKLIGQHELSINRKDCQVHFLPKTAMQNRDLRRETFAADTYLKKSVTARVLMSALQICSTVFYREQYVLAPAHGRSFVFGTMLELF